MTIELLLSLFAATAVLTGGAWALMKLTVTQFERRLDERFEAIDKSRQEGQKQWDGRFTTIEESQRRLERDFLEFKATLPTNYMRREDHVRFETGITGKLDGLNTKLELFMDRNALGEKLLGLLESLTPQKNSKG